jgi:DNA processing protein
VRGEQRAGARAMCVWLGTLASFRPGLIGGLVREYRTTAEVLACTPAEIVAFASRRRGRRAAPAERDVGGTPEERASDAARFAATLREGPAACLARSERRRPGEIVVGWSEALYPDQLRDLGDPPLCVFVRGGTDTETTRARLSAIVDAPLVAVVGARRPSPYGEEMARSLGRGLARAGLVVVSGMALGIDAVAQTAAVEAVAEAVAAGAGEAAPAAAGRTSPSTVAVLGCGADVVYPRRHARLYESVARGGLVLSEFAWGVPPRVWRFPARNRVMAALGRAVVLVEGAQRSGARITVSYAADLGRDVLCVPGEAGRRLSEAPNRLLDDGARLCESAADVLRVIGVRDPGPGSAPGGYLGQVLPALVLDHGGGAIRDVLEALQAASLTIDQLSGRCGLPVAKVAAAVSDLEVEGLARRVEGGRYMLLRG